MKLLNGTELAAVIKNRQKEQVGSLLAQGITPKLAIIQDKDDPSINLYIRLKLQYGQDIGVRVEVYKTGNQGLYALIDKLNADSTVQGIIVQLPLGDPSQTDKVVNAVLPPKDVDALGNQAQFIPATPQSILWLLEEHQINLASKRILIIGKGKLVGAPLYKILNKLKIDVKAIGKEVTDLTAETANADVIISATGVPGLLTSAMIPHNCVVIDAGTASEDGKTVGDAAPELYGRQDLSLTPQKGGVGPLTICALFENLIKASRH